MQKRIYEIKKNTEKKFLELRTKRKNVIGNFRKKVEEAKIKKIQDSIFSK